MPLNCPKHPETEMKKNRARARKNVQVEAMQVTFMIEQLKLMQPGDYQTILEDELKDCANMLRQRGVEI